MLRHHLFETCGSGGGVLQLNALNFWAVNNVYALAECMRSCAWCAVMLRLMCVCLCGCVGSEAAEPVSGV